jgi:hypothetical protein
MPTEQELKTLHQANEEATYRAIGRFITKFASVEHTMRYHLAEEIKLDLHYMSVVITHDFSLLCTAVTTVFSKTLKSEDHKPVLKRLISKCRELNDIRVKVVHGQWFAFSEGGTVAHISRRSLQIEDTTEMAKLLDTATADAQQLVGDLQLLLWNFRDVPPDEKSE